jgi:hypothetical protein
MSKYNSLKVKCCVAFLCAASLLTGCTTSDVSLNKIKVNLNCQDYSNAWARDAIKSGHIAGVMWYKTSFQTPHSVAWVLDKSIGKIRFFETNNTKRGPYEIPDPRQQPGFIYSAFVYGPYLGSLAKNHEQ